MSELSYSDKEAMRIHNERAATGHKIAKKNAKTKALEGAKKK